MGVSPERVARPQMPDVPPPRAAQLFMWTDDGLRPHTRHPFAQGELCAKLTDRRIKERAMMGKQSGPPRSIAKRVVSRLDVAMTTSFVASNDHLGAMDCLTMNNFDLTLFIKE